LYVGICTLYGSNVECRPTVGATATGLAEAYGDFASGPELEATLLSLFSLALVLQTKIILWVLASAGGFFFIGLILLALLKRHIKRLAIYPTSTSGPRLNKSLSTVMWTSLGLAVASAVSVNQTTAALQFTTTESTTSEIQILAGTTLGVLQWLVVGFSAIFVLGISSMFTVEGRMVQYAGSGNRGFAPSWGPPSFPAQGPPGPPGPPPGPPPPGPPPYMGV
jgi:hypothetical protein